MAPASVRLDVADAATIETLVEELADPDEARVLYAIDMLETLDKRNLITPLLLHHESPKVRARALLALESARESVAGAMDAGGRAHAEGRGRRRARGGGARAGGARARRSVDADADATWRTRSRAWR